jgi:hypothetical protein
MLAKQFLTLSIPSLKAGGGSRDVMDDANVQMTCGYYIFSGDYTDVAIKEKPESGRGRRIFPIFDRLCGFSHRLAVFQPIMNREVGDVCLPFP